MANFAQNKQPGQYFKGGQYKKILNFVQNLFEKVGFITIFFWVVIYFQEKWFFGWNLRFHFFVLFKISIPFKYPESKIFQSESWMNSRGDVFCYFRDSKSLMISHSLQNKPSSTSKLFKISISQTLLSQTKR